jgi:hypothetical protein
MLLYFVVIHSDKQVSVGSRGNFRVPVVQENWVIQENFLKKWSFRKPPKKLLWAFQEKLKKT